MIDKLSKYITVPLLFTLPAIWLACIFLVLNITSPLVVGPAGILLLFGLVYAFISSLLYVLLHLIIKILNKITGRRIIGERSMYYLSCVVGFGPLFLLALNTLGRLGLVEIVLVLLLVGLACFYILRRSEA